MARFVSALQRKVFGLPARRTDHTVERGVPVPMRDGVPLLTDHYAPIGSALGTVLIRTPYGRGFPESLLHGRMLAERGYHVLIQSVRGTGGSGGRLDPIAQETDDAQDAVAWLRTRPWFTGTLATLGGSYLGWTQWALLREAPPELRAAVIMVGPHDFGRAIHGTGRPALADFLGWSATVQDRGLRPMLAARKRVATALREYQPPEVALRGGAPWFTDWLEHADLTDPYWRPYDASSALRDTSVPVLLIGGWHDVFVEQTIEQYQTLRAHNADVAMTIGPWTHLDTAFKAAKIADNEALAWLDRHLAGTGPAREAAVHIQVTGTHDWLSMPSWPPETMDRVVLLETDGPTEFTHDPADPTPSVGGRFMSPGAGRKDNTKLEQRTDVVTFTSVPLDTDLEVFGSPRIELSANSDVFVRLCEVDSRGRSWNITEAFLPAAGGELGQCAHRFRAGYRLRVQISGGAYPRYARGQNTEHYTVGPTLTATLPAGTRPSGR